MRVETKQIETLEIPYLDVREAMCEMAGRIETTRIKGNTGVSGDVMAITFLFVGMPSGEGRQERTLACAYHLAGAPPTCAVDFAVSANVDMAGAAALASCFQQFHEVIRSVQDELANTPDIAPAA